MTIELPAGFTSRPATMEDVEAVTAVMAASERHHTGVANIDTEDVRADYARSSVDLARDTLLVFEDGRLVGERLVFNGRYANCSVHPELEGRGLGTAMLHLVPGDRAGANGYEPTWDSWILEIAHEDEPHAPELPPGFSIRPFDQGEAEAVHRVIEDAFSKWESRPPTPYEDWRSWALERAGFEPWMIPVVLHDDEIAGAAYLVHYPGDIGWVAQIAVGKDHRGRGLGRALLQHAFREFNLRGERATGLSTDSRTGALTLYEHVGMSVTRSYTHYAKELDD